MNWEFLKNLFAIIVGIIAVLNFIGVLFIFLANKAAFHKIMTNDLHHVKEGLTAITTEQKCIKDKVIALAEDLAFVKGSCKLCRPRKAKTVAGKKKV